MQNKILTDQELNKIFSWQPYREDWPVNRNVTNDNILKYYGKLILEFEENSKFDVYQSHDGSMSNYLEFICYPICAELYDGNAISVYISLCAPICVYGQILFYKSKNSWGHDFINPATIGFIEDEKLKMIEGEIKTILIKHNLTILDKEFTNTLLPEEVNENLKDQNLNFGDRYLNGLFQWTD